jgi:steroid delta-isomerase-like uncharacterized protein
MPMTHARGSAFDVASFLTEYYDAWGGTDEDRILSCYSQDVVLEIPGTLIKGRDALRDQFVRPFITAFPGNRHSVKNMFPGPGVVAVEFTFEAQHKGPFAGHAATGARVSLPGCGVYHYDAAKRQITAGRIYFDMGTLLQIITDAMVDDRQEQDAALRSNEGPLSVLTEAVPTFIHVLRADGSVLYVNQAVLTYTGLTLEEVRKEGYLSRVFHPEDIESLRERQREAVAHPRTFESEQRVRGRDGDYRWFLTRYNPLLDERGGIDRWYVAAFDIEDRKRAEAELKQAHLHLTEAQRLSKTGSFITDLLRDEHNWSEELRRIFDLDPGARITTEAIRALFHPEDLPVYEDAFKRAVGLDRDIDLTYRIITPAGKVKHLHAVAHLLEKIAGRSVYIGAIQDVTESKAAEAALTRARSELAHMARVTTLSALTASIAHEVNQPIAAAVTSAGACLRWLNRETPEVHRAREAVLRIEEDGRRAAEIIARLKSFYRKGVAPPRRDRVSLDDVVAEMLVLLHTEADRHAVVLRTEVSADRSSVIADRVLLQQVLMNLMLNGMEAMSAGGGELTIRTRNEGGEVIVSVSDTGVGIPSDRMGDIFDAFFTTKDGGTGMGLAISRTIIESHGGRLWPTANPGRGATFHFTLPAEPQRQA